MIDVIAMVLSIVGVPMVMSTREKIRVVGLVIWTIGNVLWIWYSWSTSQLPQMATYIWFEGWTVIGLLGCWMVIRNERKKKDTCVSE